MMLEDTIYNDYITAFKAREKNTSQFLSFIRSELKNAAINLRKEKLSDDEVLSVLNTQKKRLEEARATVSQKEPSEFLSGIEAELAILQKYLPSKLTAQELSDIIRETISVENATSMKDMGRVMKAVLAKVGIRADAKEVSDIVKKSLSA